MASSDKPEVLESKVKEQEHKEGEKGGIIEKVKEFIHEVEEKVEEVIFGKPTVEVTGIHITQISLEKVEFVVDILVTNPTPLPIPLTDINYSVESDGRKLVSGLIPDAGTIHGHGSETVKIPVTLIFNDIKNILLDVRPGSIIPYKLKVEFIVDIPVFGKLTLPLEKTGEIPIPCKPDIDLVKISFDKFTFEETVATLHLKLENKNDFELGLTGLDCEIWLSDMNIGSVELKKSEKIEKHGTGSVEIPISFRPKDFGTSLWNMISGKGIGYTLKGYLYVDSPFGPMKLPIGKVGSTICENQKHG
ncbi:LEA14-like protein [Dioscorea alata]|uniref:LEA14-like protein n=2 Tax=Dioscorea alata TaxID=55571 RepID=A0ACB7W1D4_DIOAL|nr:LEA14-like protein [Dioscorea alata]KAH7681180.1 LEA14-like protein [Dioscorea alata]